MASSGNGTFIPMVSSSPPPMDDGAFDDDDDEFSTFSSNPYGPGLDSPPGKWNTTATGQKGNGSFLPIKDDPPDPFLATAKQNISSDDGFGSFAAFSDSGTNSQNHTGHLTKHSTNNNIGRTSLNGNDDNDDDDFADFASFETTTNNKPRAGFYEDSQPPSSTGSKSDSSLTRSIELNKNNSHENSDALASKKYDVTHKHGMEIPTLSFDESPTIDSTSSLQGLSKPSISSGSFKLASGESIAGMSTKSGSDDAELHQEDGVKPFVVEGHPSDHRTDGETAVEDFSALELRGDGSGSSVSRLGMPSAGSLNLFQDSDRQTFDSGIDSIMTPDSSPEGKDDVSPKADGPDDAVGGSGELRPVENDEWGDFDTFPSPQPLSDNSEHMPSASDRTKIDSVIGESAKGKDNEFGDFGTFETFESVQQAPKEVESSSNSKGFSEEADENSGNLDVSTGGSKLPEMGDSDDDFGDFGSCREVVHRKSPSSGPLSGSDDFGGFESTASTRNDSKTKAQSDGSAGDDWGSFGSGTVPSQSDNDEFSDFGSFNSSSATSSLPADSQKDDFGSFGSFPAALSSSSTALSESAIGQQHHRTSDAIPAKVPSGGRVERIFHSCFLASMVVQGGGGGGGGGGGLLGSSSASIRVLQEVVSVSGAQGSSQSPEPNTSAEKLPTRSSSSKSVSQKTEVWSSLSDMENTVAQKYQWNNSKNSRKLLLSLGIDSRNILSSGRVGRPLFAQELGMLTPLKPGESAERSSSQGGAGGELSSSSEDATPSTLSAPEDSVTKVEFDWSGSGLINPLDANSLNLDFFATERKSSSSRTKSKPVQKVDPELLDLAVSSPPDLAPTSSLSSSSALSSSSTSVPRSTTTALDEILKHSSSSMVKQKAKREAGLSAEANVVLDSLPDLSYMLAKVLMFPVASPTGAEEGVASSTWTEQTS
ncbi:uncharacterized protein [Diadema antillarum]|uniref:uncharacterized protein n=1 Tax=Diadema antillarum TaxID=105358 RepID=UPI003A85C771